MYNARPSPPGRETITIGDRRRIKVEYAGNMDVIFHGKSDQRITLIDVAYVPDLGFNLYSLHAVRRTHLIVSDASLFSFFFFHLTYSRWTSPLPSCLWSQRISPSLPGSRLTFFLSRCKFSTLTSRQPMVEFYLLTFPRFPLRKKEHKSYFGTN